MFKNLSVLLICLLFATISFSQNSGIKGKITDREEGKPVAGATVSLLKQSDSSVVATALTSADGTFSLKGLSPDSVILQITSVNFQEYLSFITIKDTVRTLAPIMMERQNKDLASVTIISRSPPVIVKGDTAQFSASQYKVNPDATTEDLIKKMPGITVAKDGTVTAHGEQVKKVTIDGKDFFGDDASAALKNLPAEIIDKIQVFDRLSEQARLTGVDDGNSVKTINIVTKGGLKKGRYGRVYAGYGTDNRYSFGGNSSFIKENRRLSIVGNFNNTNLQNFASQDLLGLTSGTNNRNGKPGDFNVGQANGISKTNALGINYNNVYNKKLTLSGSYFYNNSINTNRSVVKTETFLRQDTSLFAFQSSNPRTENANHRINMRLEYAIDSSNSLSIIPSLNFQKNNSVTFSELKSYYGSPAAGALFDSATNSSNLVKSERNGYNLRNTLLFRHAFIKKGRSISFGFNTTFTKNNGENILRRIYRYYNSPVFTDSVNQFYDNPSHGYTIGENFTYNEPITKTAMLQLEYNPSVQINKADQQAFNFDGQKYSKLDTALSNKFDNRITTNNAGLTYRYTPNKDAQLSFGISYQHSKLESSRIFPVKTNVHQSFSSVLPNFMVRKKLSASANIRFIYRASVAFPSITQLQDVVNLTNPLRVITGNPTLKQSYTQFATGRYTYTNSKTSKSFFANLFLQTAGNYISNATFITRADSIIQNGIKLRKGTQLSKPVNLSGYRSGRIFFTYSMPVKAIKTVLNLNTGISLSRLPGLTRSREIITNNTVYSGGIVLASNISQYVDFTVSYNFNLNQTASTLVSNNNYMNHSAGLQLNLLDKKGWILQNDVSYQANSGLSAGFNQKYGLWNAAIGKKFLKKQVGELKLSVFDLLKQNQSVVRTVDEKSIQDSQNEVLKQYFMLTFTYNLKNFGTQAKQTNLGKNKKERNSQGKKGFYNS